MACQVTVERVMDPDPEWGYPAEYEVRFGSECVAELKLETGEHFDEWCVCVPRTGELIFSSESFEETRQWAIRNFDQINHCVREVRRARGEDFDER
jgi:hypothetical protein